MATSFTILITSAFDICELLRIVMKKLCHYAGVPGAEVHGFTLCQNYAYTVNMHRLNSRVVVRNKDNN
ncbi:hypothetical protein E2C01_085849 [Portunus trituberculatus]|uniref:Uncharacterized protein n=1 Tax=Portunus trituberculatus TaxID=210409 RepID=A0A5B7J9Z9_PORTR|nr:hypothetical protein [Portunus trituberculatus]